MKGLRYLFILGLLIVGVLAMAQDQEAQGAPKPPEEITKLGWAVGDWAGTTNWTMAGMPPNTQSRDTWRFEIEGQYLKMMTTSETLGTTGKETAYCGWNAEENRYDCWTFSDISPKPRIEHGTFDGTTMIMESEPWATPMGSIIGRATMVKKSDDEMSFLLEFKNGDKWDKVAEGTFKRHIQATR